MPGEAKKSLRIICISIWEYSAYSSILRQGKWRGIMSENEGKEIKSCLECGNPIPYGSRKDRIFCSEHCKNKYHYHSISKMRFRNKRLKILNALSRNYEILDSLINAKVKSISLNELILRGFNPNYMTSSCSSKPHTEYWCFEIRYYMTKRKIFNLCRAEQQG
jgi:predicted nucleic acid-binding Zn ribbon protein